MLEPKVTATTVTLRWQPPADPMGVVRGYELVGPHGKFFATSKTSFTFGGLQAGFTYLFTIRTENARLNNMGGGLGPGLEVRYATADHDEQGMPVPCTHLPSYVPKPLTRDFV